MTQGPVLVVDFGAQYAQLIARRVREAGIYSEVVPHGIAISDLLAKQPAAIILSGGPASVYADNAASISTELFAADVPVLGICYGFQLLAQGLGGEVARTDLAEFGRTTANVSSPGVLLEGSGPELDVWMSHNDAVFTPPEGFTALAATPGAPVAAFEDVDRRLFGVQWHPEVLHSENGQRVMENFLFAGVGLKRNWSPSSIISEQVAAIKAQVGEGRAICGLSGGVDSAVAAALVQRAIGDRLTCVLVDHGLMRAGEVEQVERDFVAATGVDLIVKRETGRFLGALAGVVDPEEKRKIIGREFIRVFEDSQAEIVAAHPGENVGFLVQGTLYPDV
ncbi:MAG: glutamine-hydrolyzing GMP synthase, partial [Promicromonosporaceae bacterium]|nr:glutamine-hydrolyzing GMP synthase [Promicromonosporaceae bacterium]